MADSGSVCRRCMHSHEWARMGVMFTWLTRKQSTQTASRNYLALDTVFGHMSHGPKDLRKHPDRRRKFMAFAMLIRSYFTSLDGGMRNDMNLHPCALIDVTMHVTKLAGLRVREVRHPVNDKRTANDRAQDDRNYARMMAGDPRNYARIMAGDLHMYSRRQGVTPEQFFAQADSKWLREFVDACKALRQSRARWKKSSKGKKDKAEQVIPTGTLGSGDKYEEGGKEHLLDRMKGWNRREKPQHSDERVPSSPSRIESLVKLLVREVLTTYPDIFDDLGFVHADEMNAVHAALREHLADHTNKTIADIYRTLTEVACEVDKEE